MKKCGPDFMHQEWGITSGQSIMVRRNIPKDKLTILDRQYKDHQYPTTISYCNGCIEYLEKTCRECKQESVSIREIGVQASYETTSVGSQTEYQLMDTRGNKNLSYNSIMAEYVSLTITYSISKSIKG